MERAPQILRGNFPTIQLDHYISWISPDFRKVINPAMQHKLHNQHYSGQPNRDNSFFYFTESSKPIDQQHLYFWSAYDNWPCWCQDVCQGDRCLSYDPCRPWVKNTFTRMCICYFQVTHLLVYSASVWVYLNKLQYSKKHKFIQHL